MSCTHTHAHCTYASHAPQLLPDNCLVGSWPLSSLAYATTLDATQLETNVHTHTHTHTHTPPLNVWPARLHTRVCVCVYEYVHVVSWSQTLFPCVLVWLRGTKHMYVHTHIHTPSYVYGHTHIRTPMFMHTQTHTHNIIFKFRPWSLDCTATRASILAWSVSRSGWGLSDSGSWLYWECKRLLDC